MGLVVVVLFVLGSCGFRLSEGFDDPSPRVRTRLGTVEGYYDTAYRGQKFEAYEGIPFAEPPVGDLRFEYNLLEPNPSNRLTGSEDCLYLNVYTPATKNSICRTTELLPVIFFITGGGFIYGAGSQYAPDYLLDRNVTLVTINYRVGPLGFLNTEDAIVPGNMGLKDQVIALRWVKDNIKYFGGDPSRITIVGHSAGSASVHYHYLTPFTKGLFQRGISLSGTALAPWAFVEDTLTKAQQLAHRLGCPTENNKVMVDCLKAQPAEQILNAVTKFPIGEISIPAGFGPSIEKETCESTFIDRSPMDIIASGDIQDLPWITGVVSDEAYVANKSSLGVLNDNWETIAPYLLFFTDSIPESRRSEVEALIREHYFGRRTINRTTLDRIFQLISDRWFFHHFERAVRLHARANRSPVYTYYFSYRGAHSFTELIARTTENLGVCHYDDLSYVLLSFFDATTTAEDRKMQQMLLDLWVSVATHGKPELGVEWPSLSASSTDDFGYMHIASPEKIFMKSAGDFADKSFWKANRLI